MTGWLSERTLDLLRGTSHPPRSQRFRVFISFFCLAFSLSPFFPSTSHAPADLHPLHPPPATVLLLLDKERSMEGEGIIDAINSTRGESKLVESETGIDFKRVLQDTDTFIDQRIKADETDLPKIGVHLEFLLRRSTKYKKKFGDECMSVGHLLIAFCSDERFGKSLFGNIQKSKKDLKDAVKAIHGSDRYPAQKLGALAKYGYDLTELARLSKLDPVIGREAEIELCIDILLCRTKNNPMIIGEPGVGKTAIVQGLAQRIVRGDVPTPLLNRKVISLDMGSIISGTSYRGEFETKLKNILKEVTALKGRIILFIDEIHMIVGAEGRIDVRQG